MKKASSWHITWKGGIEKSRKSRNHQNQIYMLALRTVRRVRFNPSTVPVWFPTDTRRVRRQPLYVHVRVASYNNDPAKSTMSQLQTLTRTHRHDSYDARAVKNLERTRSNIWLQTFVRSPSCQCMIKLSPCHLAIRRCLPAVSVLSNALVFVDIPAFISSSLLLLSSTIHYYPCRTLVANASCAVNGIVADVSC